MNGWNNVVDNNSGKTYGVNFGANPTKTMDVLIELSCRARKKQQALSEPIPTAPCQLASMEPGVRHGTRLPCILQTANGPSC